MNYAMFTEKKPVRMDGFFFFGGNKTTDSNRFNAARMSAAGEGLTEPNLD